MFSCFTIELWCRGSHSLLFSFTISFVTLFIFHLCWHIWLHSVSFRLLNQICVVKIFLELLVNWFKIVYRFRAFRYFELFDAYICVKLYSLFTKRLFLLAKWRSLSARAGDWFTSSFSWICWPIIAIISNCWSWYDLLIYILPKGRVIHIHKISLVIKSDFTSRRKWLLMLLDPPVFVFIGWHHFNG